MSVYLTEEEQIERIKKWWSSYGSVIVTAVLIAMVALAGWKAWQRHEAKVATAASLVYNKMLSSVTEKNNKDTKVYAQAILKDHGRTSYATMARFQLARIAVEAKDYPNAKQQLQQVMADSHVEAFQQIAAIRLAKIQLAEKNYKDALASVSKIKDSAFLPMIYYIRGDVYMAMGDKPRARMAYTSALQEMPETSFSYQFIRMKLIDIAEPEKHVESRSKLAKG